MRIKGTNYPFIKQLPPDALPVREYADKENVSVAAIYMRFDRFMQGYTTKAGTISKLKDPGYSIKCYKGMNFIVFNN